MIPYIKAGNQAKDILKQHPEANILGLEWGVEKAEEMLGLYQSKKCEREISIGMK